MKLRVDFEIFIFILFFCVVLSTAEDDDDDERGARSGGEASMKKRKAIEIFRRNRCPFIRDRLVNGRVKIRSRGRVAKFVCNTGFQLVGKRFANCVGRNWNNPIPVCVAPGCVHMDEPSNGKVTEKYSGALLDYECHPGYALYGSHTIYCNGLRWNDSVPVCEVALTHPQTFCDFEDPDVCGWTDDPNHDFNWKRHQYGTPSGHVGTGPSYDHSFGKGKAGFYMYEEASSPRKENDTSRLFSPVYPPQYSPGCFVFWYHMYGATMGSIRIYIKPESYVFGELTPSWEKHGDQGNQWLRGNVSVPTITENFQVVIEGIRGSSYVGDSAIDDVNLLQTDCSNIDAYNVSDTETGAPDSCRGRCMERNETAICGCTDECFPDSCCRDYEKICLAGNDSYSWNIETEGVLSTEQSIATFGTTEPPLITLLGVTTSQKVEITSPPLQSSSGLGRNTVQSLNSSRFSSIPAISSLLPVTTISSVASPQTAVNIPSSVSAVISSQPSPSSRLNPEVSTRTTLISTTSTKKARPVEETSHAPSTTETLPKTSSFTQTITSTIKTIPTVPVFLKTTTTKATLPPPKSTTTRATTSTQTSLSTPRPTTKPSTRNAIRTTKMAEPKPSTISTIQSNPITKMISTPIQNYPFFLNATTSMPAATKTTKPAVTNTITRRTSTPAATKTTKPAVTNTITRRTSTPAATETTKPGITNTITRRTSTVLTPITAEPTKMASPSIPLPITMPPATTLILTSTLAPSTTELKNLSTKALVSSTPLPPVAVTDTTTKIDRITSSWITHRLTTNTRPKNSSISSSTLPMSFYPPPPSPTTTSLFSSTTTSSLSSSTKRNSTSSTSGVFQTTVMMTTRSTLPPRTTGKRTTQSSPPNTTKPPLPPPPQRTEKPTSPPPPPRTAKPTSSPPPPPRTSKPTSPLPPPRTAKPSSPPPQRTAKPSSPPPPPRTAKPSSPPPPPPQITAKPTLPPSPRTTLTITPITKRISTVKNVTSKIAETATISTKKDLDNSSRSTSNANLIAGISVAILLLLCLVGGVGYVFWRHQRQRELSDDSEMRFLPENEVVEFSEVSSFTDCLMEDT